MSNKYRYDRRARKHKKRQFLIVFLISALIVAVLVFSITLLIKKTTKNSAVISGPTVSSKTVVNSSSKLIQEINEPSYKFELPTMWQQIKQVTSPSEHSITWQSFVKNATNRYLTIYTSPIPTTFPVNRELPIESRGSTIGIGTLSDNCANFTNGGTPRTVVPVLAKWENVNFYCNIPNFVDNQIGTGTTGAINSITLIGPQDGSQNYFFLYIDRNIAPDYSIFYSILSSFQTK